MARSLKDLFAALSDDDKAELLSELPAFVAGLTPEQRKALDIQPPPPPEPAPAPKRKTLLERLDEWAQMP